VQIGQDIADDRGAQVAHMKGFGYVGRTELHYYVLCRVRWRLKSIRFGLKKLLHKGLWLQLELDLGCTASGTGHYPNVLDKSLIEFVPVHHL